MGGHSLWWCQAPLSIVLRIPQQRKINDDLIKFNKLLTKGTFNAALSNGVDSFMPGCVIVLVLVIGISTRSAIAALDLMILFLVVMSASAAIIDDALAAGRISI